MAQLKTKNGLSSEKIRLRHRLLPRSLFGRSLLIIAVPVILLQLIVAFIFFDRHWASTSDRLVFALAAETDYIASQMQEAESVAEREKIATAASQSLGVTVVLSKAPDNFATKRTQDPFSQYSWFSVGPKLEEELDRKLDTPFAVRPYERERWFVIDVEYAPGEIFSILSHERRLVSSTTYIFILWLIGSAFVLFSVAILFMRNQIRPILRLAVAAEKLGRGQDVPDFRPMGATEVRKAATAFIRMKERLRRQIEQRTLMLAGVSHDLRTPLTRMKLQAEMALPGPDADALKQDIAEMERMVDGYLAFAKGEGDEATTMTDLADIIQRVAANATRVGHIVHIEDSNQRLMARIRPMAVERAMANVVGNATTFGKNVWIKSQIVDDEIEITIDDDGPGISPQERASVFRPFYRIEKSRNKKTGGVGLGLSITQDVMHGHGGEIVLGDSPRGGLRVILRLPV